MVPIVRDQIMAYLPQRPAKHRSHICKWLQSIHVSVWQTVPISNAIKFHNVGDRHVRKILLHNVLAFYDTLLKYGILVRTRPTIWFHSRLTFPKTLNIAPFSAALRTPLGLQLNLYPRGTPSAYSGAGKPPQKDVKDTMRFLSARNLSISETAEQWSIPGSRPISFKRMTSASTALDFNVSRSTSLKSRCRGQHTCREELAWLEKCTML